MKKDKGKIKALLNLLDDPDESIYKPISKEIEAYGENIIPILEQEWESNSVEIVQRRIEDIIRTIQFSSLKEQLIAWKLSPEKNLLDGYILFSKYNYPDIDENIIRKKINALKDEVWKELNDSLTALQKIKVLNYFFYDIKKFYSYSRQSYLSNDLFINNVLDNKRGNPLSLGILYGIIAEQLNMPVRGVNLPMHYVLAYVNTQYDVPLIDKEAVLFYINPANKGSIFTYKEILLYLSKAKLEVMNEYTLPCDNITIIKSLFEYLKNIIVDINSSPNDSNEEPEQLIFNNDKKPYDLGLDRKISELNELIELLEFDV